VGRLPKTTGRLGYEPALDGVRGVAILLVIGNHYLGILGGTLGVDLFFVLSGFLITTLLLEEREAHAGRIDISRFYVRRARRLLPALITMLAVYLTVERALGRDALRVVSELGLYTGNAFRAFTSVPPTGLEHLWSLATEEQFYLLWPVILLALARTRRAFPWLVALIAVAMAYRLALAAAGASHFRLYFGPDTHDDGLLLGAAAAVLRRRGWTPGENTASFGLVLVALGIVVRGAVPDPYARWWDALGLPIFELGTVALIAAAAAPTGVQRLLRVKPLVWLGAISYSLYLWHLPLLWWLPREHSLALALAFAAAWLSYRFVEQPFLRRPARETGLAIGVGLRSSS
jgi:peptidoglycan/LPS O-acetylase OafA/YrhL